MHNLDKLIKEAEKSTKWRGHRLSNWVSKQQTYFGKPINHYTAFNECLNCGMKVHVDTSPSPNGIDIAGEAVALNCTKDV